MEKDTNDISWASATGGEMTVHGVWIYDASAVEDDVMDWEDEPPVPHVRMDLSQLEGFDFDHDSVRISLHTGEPPQGS